MKWIKANIIPIVLCVGAGYCLRFINEYLGLSSSHIFQDFLILAFVVLAFWQKKISALILSILTILFLLLIEIYSPLPWNPILRGLLIIILLSYLVIWTKSTILTEKEL